MALSTSFVPRVLSVTGAEGAVFVPGGKRRDVGTEGTSAGSGEMAGFRKTGAVRPGKNATGQEIPRGRAAPRAKLLDQTCLLGVPSVK